MFEACETLSQLNAERVRLSQTENIVEVNNAYNARRIEILSARLNFNKLTPVFVTIEEAVKYSGIPIAGRSSEVNTIELTPSGFLF